MPSPNNQGYGYGGYGSYPPQMPEMPQQMPEDSQPQLPEMPQPQMPQAYGGYGYQNQPPQPYPMGQPGYMGQMPGQMPGMPPQKKGLGIGAIIGIVAGILALVAIVVGFFLIPKSGGGDDDVPSGVTRTGDDNQGTTGDTQGNDTTGTGDGSEGDSTGTGDSPASAGSSEWLSGEFTLEGQSFTLLKSGFRDLEAAGWHLTDEAQESIDTQYGGSFVVNKNTVVIGSLDVTTGEKDGVSINVTNLGDAPQDFRDCTLCEIKVDGYDYSFTPETPASLVIAGGGTLGMTVDEIKGIYGEPQDSYTGTGGYSSLTYQPEGEYTKSLDFTFTDGKVTQIRLMLA